MVTAIQLMCNLRQTQRMCISNASIITRVIDIVYYLYNHNNVNATMVNGQLKLYNILIFKYHTLLDREYANSVCSCLAFLAK